MAVLLNRAAVPTSFKKLMGTPCQQSGQQRLSYLKSQKHRVENGAEDVGGAGWQQRGESHSGGKSMRAACLPVTWPIMQTICWCLQKNPTRINEWC